MEDVWFRTNSLNELMESAAFSLEAFQRLPSELGYVRWAIIGSVLSLQGACVFQLDGHDSTGTAVLTDDSRKKVLKHLGARPAEPFPIERLASPKRLLSRVRLPEETSNEFTSLLTDEDVANCEYLAMLRNEFVHFLPQGWSHNLYGFSGAMQSLWKIVDVLVASPIEYEHRVPSEFRNKFADVTRLISVELKRIDEVL